jgi:hypothetical protein
MKKVFSVTLLTFILVFTISISCDKDKEKSIVGPGEDTYTISGRVIQDDGTIISNIFVTIIGTSIKETTIIDRWGTFSFEGLPTGDYILTPFNGGFQKYKFYPSNKEISITYSNVKVDDFCTWYSENESEIIGKILDIDNHPVCKVAVRVSSQTVVRHGLTNCYGFYRVRGKIVRNESYKVV